MGINVIKKAVQIDATHNRGVNTSTEHNPSITKAGELSVYQIFSRNKEHGHTGDGNPLVYAMKDINGYTIVPMYRNMVLRLAGEILAKLKGELTPDCIVAAPSSNTFANEFAQLVSETLDVPLLPNTFLRKKTVGEMVEQYGANIPQMMPKHQKEYKSQIGKWRKVDADTPVSMKPVDTNIREHFKPMVTEGPPPPVIDQHILVVDDLMASGSTIGSIVDILYDAGAKSVTGLCFLGKLPSGS